MNRLNDPENFANLALPSNSSHFAPPLLSFAFIPLPLLIFQVNLFLHRNHDSIQFYSKSLPLERLKLFCCILSQKKLKRLAFKYAPSTSKFQMLVSKQKSNLAYAKICKDKSAPLLTSQNLTPQGHSRKNSKQNIYEELINDLQPDESVYIQQLLTKQQKKSKKTNKEKQKLGSSDLFRDRSNKLIPSPAQKKSAKVTSRKQSNKEIASTHKIPMHSPKQGNLFVTPPSVERQNLEELQPPRLANNFQPEQKCSFVNSITDYLNSLSKGNNCQGQSNQFKKRKQPQPTEMDEQQSREEQQSRGQEGQYWAINTQDYKNLVNQLQQAMLTNEILEQKIEHKDRKVKQLKNVIQSLCSEINHIKKELKSQHKLKNNYELICKDFASNVEKVQSQSRISHSSHKHMQRYSYIPPPREIEQDFQFRQSELPLKFRNTHDFSQISKFKEDCSSLKKKGKHHKYVYNHNDSLTSSQFPRREHY